MACLPPSPSGRRLSELLEEKQEPFVLDLHLLEKGCSASRLLDGYDTAVLCWPAAAAGNDGGAAAAVLRRLTSKKNKTAKAAAAGGKKQQSQPSGGLLQLVLSKILGCSISRAAKPAALQFSDSFKLPAATAAKPAAVAPAPCSDLHMELDAVKAQDAAAERCYGDSDTDSDDEEQQLSPVSVLDHPFETSPPSKGGAAAVPMHVFRDLLDAGYSPALLAQLLAKSEDLLAADEDDDCCYGGGYYRTSPKLCRADEPASAAAAAAYWDAHREELARVSGLVASELPSSKLGAADVEPERGDVGAEVEAAVFEALLRELVVDLRSSCCC